MNINLILDIIQSVEKTSQSRTQTAGITKDKSSVCDCMKISNSCESKNTTDEIDGQVNKMEKKVSATQKRLRFS